MAIVARYEIACPCGETISLTETTLAKIIQHLQWSDKDERLVNFVCSRCKTAFRYDYQNRKPVGVIDAHPQSSGHSIGVLSLKCSNSNCVADIKLIAVRRSGTTIEAMQEELQGWKISESRCGQGLPPDPSAPWVGYKAHQL